MSKMIECLEPRRLLSASVSQGTLTITGTDSADRITVVQRGGRFMVREASSISRFGRGDHIQRIIINALGGNDRIKITSKLGATVDGGDGRDLIAGGAGDDVLMGGNGNDRILGQRGKDAISGGAGRDLLFGGAGDDTIDAYDTQADQIAGGGGDDKARVDVNVDMARGVEGYLEIESNNLGTPISVITSGTLRVSGVTTLNGNTIHTGLIKAGLGTLSLNGNGASLVIDATPNVNLTGNTIGGPGAVTIDAGDPSSAQATVSTTLANVSTSGATHNVNGITGFTTGTYRLINFAGSSGSILISTSGSSAFNYAITDLTRFYEDVPEPAATDPVILTGPESAEEPVVVEDPAAAPST